MSLAELFLTAVGLSMDALAVAVAAGLAMRKVTFKKALTVGLYFGVFQAVMPLIGYLAASAFDHLISAYDHWIAFGLLAFLGGKMMVESFKTEGCADRVCPDGACPDRKCPGGQKPDRNEPTLTPREMLPLAVATSIDALAAGISFALLDAPVVPAVSFIGVITMGLSMLGVRLGSVVGARFKSRAELAGGVILALIGLKILLEHLGLLAL